MAWNFASSDFTVSLSFDVDSEHGRLNGTLNFKGITYALLPKSGLWAASGVNGRKATPFVLLGTTGTDAPNYLGATGIVTGEGETPTQIDINIGVSSSLDGSLIKYKGVLKPTIVDLKPPGTEPFLSGEINALQSLSATTPVAATIFNNSIFLLSDNNLSTFDLKKLVNTDSSDPEAINTDALSQPSHWKSSPNFSSLMTSNWHPDGLSRSSLAATPAALYMFFNGRLNQSQAFVAYQFTLDQDDQQTPILLFREPSKQLRPPLVNLPGLRSDISSTVFGDDIVFVACSRVVVAGDASGEALETFIGVYDTGKIKIADEGSSWTASSYRYLQSDTPGVAAITLEWFSTIGADGQPAFYLAVIASDITRESPPTSVVWYVPFTVTQATNGGTVVALSDPGPGRYMNHAAGEDDLIETLVRDPAGRVRGWGRPSIPQTGPGLLRGHILETLEEPSLDGVAGCPGVRERLPASDTLTAPSSFFYVFTPGATKTTFKNRNATDYPVYEFIFYGQKPTFQVNRYGTIQVVAGTDTQNLPPTPTWIIGGIIDGPIPLPMENYKDYKLSSPEIIAGSVVYGSSNAEITSREVSNKQTAGFKSSGKVTKGVGVAWDISLESGMGSASGHEKQTTLSYGLPQPAIVSEENGPPAVISPNGTLQLLGVYFDLGAYRFLDMFGVLVSDAMTGDSGQSQKVATILPGLSTSGTGSFLPYLVTPGDLKSYTPQNINLKMQALSKAPVTDNYFGKVICTNAYPFTSEQPYLPFSWSEGSPSQLEFTQFKSSYTENSYTFDWSIYAGVSEGFGMEVFGLGAEEEAEFLGGATYSHESTESENNETEWGIRLDGEWGPPARAELPDSVVAYDFRLYFLPVPKSPSNLPASAWIDELRKYLPAGSDVQVDNIDKGSCCWRIVFVVTRIQYREEDADHQNYFYDGDLDLPSVYANGNSRRS